MIVQKKYSRRLDEIEIVSSDDISVKIPMSGVNLHIQIDLDSKITTSVKSKFTTDEPVFYDKEAIEVANFIINAKTMNFGGA